MDDPETLATFGTQDTGKINIRENLRAIKNGLSRDTGNIWHTRHRTKANKPQDTGQINVRENIRGTQ